MIDDDDDGDDKNEEDGKKWKNRCNTNIKIYSINCLFVFSKVSPLYYVVNLEQILEVK